MTALRLLPFGDRAVVAEVDGLADVLALHSRLASRPDGVVDVVPAARTVLVQIDPRRMSPAAARAWIAHAAEGETPAAATAAVVEVPITYDGADLDDVAAALGIRPDELAARHAACLWTVAFTGFAPGFGYLVSADWPYEIPRRASPRTRVPAGAVGLAGEFTGAYPRETPGGWQLIGSTPATLFDPGLAEPALLGPGARVRFVPAPASSTERRPAGGARGEDRRPGARMRERGLGPTVRDPALRHPALRVVDPGLSATLQDQGRPHRGSDGIAVSGAADRAALRTAQRLVGNAEDAAGIEVTMGGFRAVAETDLWVAVTGAWGRVRHDGRPIDPYIAHPWPRGAELHLEGFTHGARAYLAVRGGLDTPEGALAAGSRSTDTLSGLGPAPLRAGDVLTLAGAASGPIPVVDLRPWSPPTDAVVEIALDPGPRADWVEDVGALFAQMWTVSPQADRVGIRLDGRSLARRLGGELPSEGMLPGAIQVPPDGRPVLLGPDGPVTGGYPVVAVVADASRDALAQVRPGRRIRFRHARPAG